MNNPEEEKYISLQEATKYCNYTQEYLSLRARQGKLKSVKIGRNWVTKKEWLEEYLKKAEKYNNQVKVKKFKEVAPLKELAKVIKARPLSNLRFGFVLALAFVLLTAGIVFGKDSLKSVYQDLIDTQDRALSRVASGIENWKLEIENLAQGTIDYTYNTMAGVGDELVGLVEKVELTASVAKEISQEMIGTFKEFGQWVGESIKNQIAKIRDSFVKGYEFITRPWRTPFLEEVKVVEVKKEEIEKLQAEIKELKEKPVKEIVREIEVSKVTKVEPIKEITKEKIITKIDDKELAKIKKELSSFALWGRDIENFRAITQKLQAHPVQTPVPTAPLYIGSQGIQVGGIGNFASLGVSGFAGIGNLGVGGSTSLGSTPSDKLTVQATSEFNAPVFAKAGLTVGRGTLTIDEKGNLTTTGRIAVKSDLVIEKNLIVHGVQTHSGLTIAGPVITSATGVLSSEAQLAIARGGTGLSALGTANQLLGVNAGATGLEYKTIAGTTNQITVTHAPGSITLATPQDIATTSSPTFAALTLSGTTPLTLTGTSPVTITRSTTTPDILAIDNLGIGTLSLNLVDGGLRTAGIERLTNAGALTNITGITSSGTITFSGLTADRLVTTTTGGALTTSITSANLAASVTDETGSGLLVFGTSPSFTTSLVTGSASFDVFNTTATTINAFGAATALTIGATSGTTTIRNTNLALNADSAVLNFSSITGTKQIQTGGATHLALMPGGNVGIGTTAPATRLHIAGTTRGLGGAQILGLPTPGTPTVTPQGTTGTTTWGYRITARSSVGETLASTEGRTTTGNAILGATNFNRVAWTAVDGAVDYRIYRTTAGGTPSTTGLIGTTTSLTFDDTGLAALGAVPTIDSSGNVGIGTTGPTHKLDVRGDVTAGAGVDGSGIKLRMLDGVTVLRTFDPTNVGNINSINFGTVGFGGDLRAHGTNILFLNPVGTTEYMRITNAGNVGIGTTAPGYKLQVRSDGLGTWQDRMGFANATADKQIFLATFGSNAAIASHNFALNAWAPLYVNTVDGSGGGNVIMSGNVGIGTTTPTHQLQLSLDSAAKPGTNTWTIVSDIRVKEDIRPYTGGLEIIRQINPVWYKYNGLAGFTADGKDNIGVIAQDIVNVVPYTVRINKTKLNSNDLEKTELLTFNSHALTFAFINAFKEMDKQIEELKLQLNQNGDLLQNGQEVNSQFVNSQSNNSLIETIKQALASLGLFIENGIAKVRELFAEKVTTKQICLEDDDGKTICVDKNQLKELLQRSGIGDGKPAEQQETSGTQDCPTGE